MTTVQVATRTTPWVRKTPIAFVDLVAAATSGTLWATSTGRTACIKKLMVTNKSGSDIFLNVGIGIAGVSFTQIFPSLKIINGFDAEFSEQDLPEYWFGMTALGNILVQASAAGAIPNDVQVFAEIEEKGA